MKLYNALGPNPRLVRMFLAEKGVELPSEEIDIMKAENRGEAYRKKNPFGQMPSLELDDGAVLGETVAICSYLDERYPQPPLLGTTAEERAEALMWTLRVMLNVTEPMSNGFRWAEGLSMFKDRTRCVPEASDGLKAIARDGLALFDRLLEGRNFLAGDRFTLADIVLYSLLDFFAGVGQQRDPALKNLEAWYERVNARPSTEASLHPVAKGGGMRA